MPRDCVSFSSLPGSSGSPPSGGFGEARLPLSTLSEFPEPPLKALEFDFAKIKDQPKIIPAHSNREMLSVSWRFSEDTPASEIMGDSGRILFHLKVGSEEKSAEIEYRRSKCC